MDLIEYALSLGFAMGFYRICINTVALQRDFIDYASLGFAMGFYRICIITEVLQWDCMEYALSLWFCIWIL